MERRLIDNYGDAVSYLCGVPRFTKKNTMEDTRAQLVRLGSPDKKIKHIIHVAGTNGKGSVCAYLRFLLEEAGYTTAVFTSPHLVDIRERMAVHGEPVSEQDFLRAFRQVYDSLDWEELEQGRGYHPTFFEYLFFMAMLLFSEKNPDYCILETGLGGRLDATNAVERKDLTVITRIGLDHTEYLGGTITEIAGEKAGIMRAGVPCVYCADVEEAAAVFAERARKLGAEGYPVSKKDYNFLHFENKSIDFSLNTQYYDYIRVILHTQARYQMENAALAVRAIEALDRGRSITAAQIRRGLAKAFWQGRMEEILPEVYVDGAHNEDGVRAFLDTVAQDGCRRRTLLFSVVGDKDYRAMLERILSSGCFAAIAVARMETGRAVSLEKLRETLGEIVESANAGKTEGADAEKAESADAEKAESADAGKAKSANAGKTEGADAGKAESADAGKTEGAAEIGGAVGTLKPRITFYDNVWTALKKMLDERGSGERIYIAGSLYLVGEIKELLKDD